MPTYAFMISGEKNGLQRVLLTFPRGVDLGTAVQYVCKNYQCKATPISLSDVGTDVIEVMKQSAPRAVSSDDEEGGELSEDGSLQLSGIEGADDTPETIEDGSADRPS